MPKALHRSSYTFHKPLKIWVHCLLVVSLVEIYHNDPKFSDRQVKQHQVVPLCNPIRVYTVCQCVYTFWMHHSKVNSHCPNFSMITTFLSCVRICRIFMVYLISSVSHETVHSKIQSICAILLTCISAVFYTNKQHEFWTDLEWFCYSLKWI